VAPGDERLDGVVAEYDEHVGLGVVRTAADVPYGFHCTQIAGGARTIPVGQQVTFVVMAGRSGRWEAGDVRPVGGGAGDGGGGGGGGGTGNSTGE
jgi:cold shock CspA family protein